jgi:hypothetical protein
MSVCPNIDDYLENIEKASVYAESTLDRLGIYRALLQEPTASLVRSPERDNQYDGHVILGYN